MHRKEVLDAHTNFFKISTTVVMTPMWDTCSVQLKVRLPKDIVEQVEEVQRQDPEFLSRVVLYGLTRRSIYRQLADSGVTDTPASTESDHAIL